MIKADSVKKHCTFAVAALPKQPQEKTEKLVVTRESHLSSAKAMFL